MKDIKTAECRVPEMMNHIPQDARVSVKTKDAILLQNVDAEQPSMRLKPTRTINERLAKGSPAGQGNAEQTAGGSANQVLTKVSVIKPASVMSQAATQAATDQIAPKVEPVQVAPHRAIERTATVIGQSNRVVRQSAAGAISIIASGASSPQLVSRRSEPRVKGAPALKLLKRGVVQAGRGVKYAASKTADKLSRDPAAVRSNPDKAVSDLAVRQAKALAGKAAQAAAQKAAQTAGRAAAKLGAQASRLAMKIMMALIQAAAKAISALAAAAGPVVVVIIVVVFSAILAIALLSPMGIFGGGGGDGTPTISQMVGQLNGELADKIATMKENAGADRVTVTFNGSDVYSTLTNWPDILAVFAVKVGLDPEQPSDVVILDTVKQDALREVFWSMVSVSSSIEMIDAPGTSPSPSAAPTPAVGETPAAQSTPTPIPKLKIQLIKVSCMEWEDAQQLFALTDDQVSVLQSMMSARPYTMLAQLAGAATGEAATDWSGIIDVPEGGMPIPLYLQGQYSEPVCYIDGEPISVASCGCGAASASMVIAYLTGNTVQTPYTLFTWAYDHGYNIWNGLGHSCLTSMANLYGVEGTWIANDQEKIAEALRAGHPVIAHMGPGIFTTGGHYIVLRGITEDGHVLVNDPGSRKRNKYAYLLSTVVAQARTSSSFMICKS